MHNAVLVSSHLQESQTIMINKPKLLWKAPADVHFSERKLVLFKRIQCYIVKLKILIYIATPLLSHG